MSNELRHIIKEFRQNNLRFNKNDVLVNLHAGLKSVERQNEGYVLREEEFPNRILTDFRKDLKESGIYTLCLSVGVIHHGIGKDNVESPIWLYPLEFKHDKVRKEYRFSFDEEDGFVNPYLQHLLREKGIINFEITTFDTAIESINESGFSTDDKKSFIGNFHHHRFDVLRELEELENCDKFSSSLKELIGESKNTVLATSLTNSDLFPSDPDHCKVYNTVKNGNCVIQGPPGTGKSQALTNLAGKMLFGASSVLFVSEKRAALDVIVQKMKQKGLDKFAHISTSGSETKELLNGLKSTWEYLEMLNPEPAINLRVSEQYEAQMQLILDMLNNDRLIGGISYYRFLEYTRDMDLTKGEFNSGVPDLDYFVLNESLLRKIYSSGLEGIISRMKTSFFQHPGFVESDIIIRELFEELVWFNNNFNVVSWSDITDLMKKSALYQVYENESYRKHTELFKVDSKVNKKFIKFYSKWKKANLEFEKVNAKVNWKSKPSELEIKSLLILLDSHKYLDKYKSKKLWKKFSDLPISFAPEFLAIEKSIQESIKNITQLRIELCEIGILEPEIELDQLYLTWTSFSESKWIEIQEASDKDKRILVSVHVRIQKLYDKLKGSFSFSENDDMLGYFNLYIEEFGKIYSLQDELKNLNNSVLDLMKISSSFNIFLQTVMHSHWVMMNNRFPVMAGFSFSEFKRRVEKIILTKDEESELFAKQIEYTIYQRFIEYNRILAIPAVKLNSVERDLKKRLKKGKSILVKEFSKTRNHPSIRELFNSEAGEWIQLLKPLWLSNPVQLARCFPMKCEMFDFAFFDEASQIPLENALGAVQRARKVIVAGDEQQMSPTSYFTSKSGECTDLLHQASFYLPKVMLTHHYRSEYPELIEFSNKYFYDNQLITFSSFEIIDNPLNLHFVKDSLYENRRNEKEAKMVAAQIEIALTKNENIGVVAFSEEQLKCIFEQLSPQSQLKLVEHIEQEGAFFKTLENVQGDECDNLIISFGYGYNSEGKFNMQFGPMNRPEGSRRLNVLLTRARHAIHFYTSVKSQDFKISDNESIDLLRKWFLFLENVCNRNETTNHNLKKDNLLPVHLSGEKTSGEICTYYRIMKARGWEPVYQ